MGLKLSITTIRSVVETSTDNARQRGIITSVEQNSVQKLNGHSSAVVNDYYLRQDVANNVSHGRKAFTAMSKASMNLSVLLELILSTTMMILQVVVMI